MKSVSVMLSIRPDLVVQTYVRILKLGFVDVQVALCHGWVVSDHSVREPLR